MAIKSITVGQQSKTIANSYVKSKPVLVHTGLVDFNIYIGMSKILY